jgi:hypothetical protein
MAAAVELDFRSSGNVDVTLFWDPEDGSVVVQVIDWATQEDFTLSAEPAKALDVFTHPYAYAYAGPMIGGDDRALEAVADGAFRAR